MEQQTYDFASYSSFRETVNDLTESLEQLKEYAASLNLENTARSIGDIIEKSAGDHFEVAIVGEFKRGKSTLINALLGQEVLPADVLPATATLNRVTYSKEPYVNVEYKDGTSENVDINQLADYVTKLSFDSEKNIKLATYASRCIENEILMYLRRNSRTRMEVSIDEPLNVDWDGNELLLSDILGTDEDIIYRDMEDEAEKKLLRRAVNRLVPREKMIIDLLFGLSSPEGTQMTQKEGADLLGISQSYISRLEKKIIKRLKRDIVRYE